MPSKNNVLSLKAVSRLLNNCLLIFFSAVLVTIVLGCQTVPKKFDQFDQGQWQARALVRDKVKGKSHVVNLDLNAVKGEKLRMDVTSTVGIHVASLVLIGNDLKYALIRDKKFYQGRTSPSALQPVIAVPVDPHLFYNILFDQPVMAPNWKCSESEGLVKECQNKVTKLSIRWDRKGQFKTVFVEHEKGSLQLNFRSFESKVSDKAGLFELTAPKGFSQYRI